MTASAKIVLSLAAAILALSPARAELAGPSFAPAVGSRWTVEDVDDSVTLKPDGKRETQVIKQSGVLVFKERTPTGFIVAYEVTGVDVSGTAPGVAVVGPALGDIKGVVFEAELDASGKPVSVRNLAAVHVRMREIIERAAKPFEQKLKYADLLRDLLTKLLILEGKSAAETYLQPATQMAFAQNTGLKLGEAKQETTSTPNPLGGDPITSIAVFRFAKRDPAGDVSRFTRLERLEEESLKAAVMTITRRLMRDAGTAPTGAAAEALDAVAKQITLTSDTASTYEVRGGVTRTVEQNSVMRASAMGQRFSKEGKRRVTIDPAP